MNKDEIVKDIAETTCEFETPCNECEFNSKKYRCSYKAYAEQVYNAGYRKVADDDDEIVESMKTYERARQETAREVVKKIIDAGELDFCTALCLDHNKNAVTKRIGRFYADVDKLNEALSEYGIEIKETGATIKE